MVIAQFSKQIAKGTFWSLSGNMAQKLISFIYLVMLTRLLSQSEVGLFYSALSIFGLIIIFSDLGLRGSLIRYIPYFLGKQEKEKILMLVNIAYIVSAVFSLAITLILFFGADMFADYLDKPSFAPIIKLFSPYILLTTLFNLNRGMLTGLKDIRAQSAFFIFQNFTKLIFTIVLFFIIGANLFSVTIGFLASLLVALLASLYYMRKSISEFAVSVKKTTVEYSTLLQEIIPFGLMISIISSFWLIVTHTDRTMIFYLLGEDPVAVYTTASNLAMLIMIFPAAISTIFLPIISELFGKGKKEEMVAAASTSIRWMLFITIPLSIVLISFPERLLDMFFGSIYAAGGFVLAIFTLGLLIRLLSYMQAFTLAGMRLVRIELKVAAAAALTNVLLNILLIPLYGIEGAAVASAVAFLVATLLFVHYSRKIFGFKFPLEAFKAVFAGAIALGIIFLAKPYLGEIMGMLPEIGEGDVAAMASKVLHLGIFGALFLISGALYLVALFLLRTFTEEDINLLAAAMRKAKIPEYWIETISKFFLLGVYQK
jgi:O-antigen/teichoic acid export membrane protein